jgi:glycosyltransferase involved in cell wall biosynthesis
VKVAAFTPGPPKRSGGAVYAGALLPALAEHVDVVAVSPDPVAWDGPTVHPDDVDPAAYDVLVHFLADNADHLFAYRSALRFGGVVVCHDLMLPHLLQTFAPDEEAADLADQLGEEGAAAVLARRRRGAASHQEVYLLPVVSRAVRRADAAIVHSRYGKFVLESEVPGLRVDHVPTHAGAVPDDLVAADTSELRARLGLPPTAFLVGMFGYLGGHKRVGPTLTAVAAAIPVARRAGIELRPVLVGAEVGGEVNAALRANGLEDVAIVRGQVDDRSFFEHLAAVDVLVALRYPTLGESSATIAQAMRLGKPVVTSDHAQFGEERAAIRVPPDGQEVDRIADALVALATCAHCRSVAAEQSTRQGATATLAATVAGYVDALEASRA